MHSIEPSSERRPSRLRAGAKAAALLATATLAFGCATPAPASSTLGLRVPSMARASGSLHVPRLPTPDDARGAREMLEGALIALDDGNGAVAAAFLQAILRSDQLTDRGRANVYWLSAEAYRQMGDEPSELSSLQGFLVAAEVVLPDEDLERRAVQARAWLLAHRLRRDPGLGKTPHQPILVEDTRDPGAVLASLQCGPAGEGRYIVVADEPVSRGRPDEGVVHLVHRRAQCESGGPELDLWFDVTLARRTEREPRGEALDRVDRAERMETGR